MHSEAHTTFHANTDCIKLACCSVTVYCKSKLSSGSINKGAMQRMRIYEHVYWLEPGQLCTMKLWLAIYSVNYSLITNCWLYVSMIQACSVIHLAQHVRSFRSTISSLVVSVTSFYAKKTKIYSRNNNVLAINIHKKSCFLLWSVTVNSPLSFSLSVKLLLLCRSPSHCGGLWASRGARPRPTRRRQCVPS